MAIAAGRRRLGRRLPVFLGRAERGERIPLHGGRQRGLHEHRHAALGLHALRRMDLDHPDRRTWPRQVAGTPRTADDHGNHRCEYVATASTAYMEDLYEKLDKALAASEQGFAYLHVYSPCTTGWRFQSALNIEVARKAVESNFVTLWEYTPEAGLPSPARWTSPRHRWPTTSKGDGALPPPARNRSSTSRTRWPENLRFVRKIAEQADEQ